MSNIGYAVFGMPKGLAVVSNGLFKTLNLDKSLYLNNVHVVLEKEEQALIIRRIPSNPNDLEKKDSLLVALYENALQYGENRAGGFVGSAICFKEKMPNGEEMISGLVYLFSKMKENVDANNRFTSTDSSDWNASLPDAGKKFGLEDSKLNYAATSTASKNLVVKLNSLEKEAASLLYNFALNRAFHTVDYVYASSSKIVVDKIKSNGFLQVPFAEFFNYNKHLNYYKEKQVKDVDNLKFIKQNAAELQKKIAIDSNEVKGLENKINTEKSELSRIDQDIRAARSELNLLANKKKELSRNPHSQRLTNNGSRGKLSSEDEKKYNQLKDTVDAASSKIKEIKNTGFNSENYLDALTRRSQRVEHYFSSYDERKVKNNRRLLIVFSTLLIMLMLLVVLFIWKSYELNDIREENKRIEQRWNDKKEEEENDKKAAQQSEQSLKTLKSFEKGNATFDPKKFYETAEDLLENHLAGKTNDKEENYINERKWEFFEFDYTNEKLVKKLDPSSKSDDFILIDKDKYSRRINSKYPWSVENKLRESLQKYLAESNDVYQYLEYNKVLKDEDRIIKHFEWIIKEVNGVSELSELEGEKEISLPFYDLKK
jgi:hypothetical protein